MKIETKFNVGENVYYLEIVETPILEECKECSGRGEFSVTTDTGRSVTVGCDTCVHRGKISRGKISRGVRKTYSVSKKRRSIQEVSVKYTLRDGMKIHYGFSTLWDWEDRGLVNEQEVFKTKKEAKEACAKKNAEEDFND